jgi:hypothetical protein
MENIMETKTLTFTPEKGNKRKSMALSDSIKKMKLMHEKAAASISTYTDVDELKDWMSTVAKDGKLKTPSFNFRGYIVGIQQIATNNHKITRIK